MRRLGVMGVMGVVVVAVLLAIAACESGDPCLSCDSDEMCKFVYSDDEFISESCIQRPAACGRDSMRTECGDSATCAQGARAACGDDRFVECAFSGVRCERN